MEILCTHSPNHAMVGPGPPGIPPHGFAILNETGLSGVGAIVDAQSSAGYIHIDDGLFMSDATVVSSPIAANRIMLDVASTMDDWGTLVGSRPWPSETFIISVS